MNQKKNKKRENGTGSVIKRKDKVYRPWVARATVKSTDGTTRRVTIGCYETAREAKSALDSFLESPTTKINITFSQLFEEWKSVSYRNISKYTIDNYDACYKKLSSLYDLKFKDIRLPDMQFVVDQYLDMSHSTLTKIKALLTQLFDYAIQNDIVNKNYAEFLVLPKQESSEKEVFTDLEIEKIYQAADCVEYADIILMLIYTGFRISEFLELTPFNYDAKTACLRGGKKTTAGKNRIVPVHPKIQPYLDKWLSKGGTTIFCRPDGTPFSADNFRKKYYYPTLEKIGVRQLSPHATRHTFATMLAKQNIRPENIQKLMGHSKYDVTADVYIHQDNDTLREAIEKLA